MAVKENDSEIEFEEPRTALIANQNKEDRYQENDESYLFAEDNRRRRSCD
jgi:hypothetical protein